MTDEPQTFGFKTSYSVEVDPEFPGDGAWDVPVHRFRRDGSLSDEFESRWGTPVVVRVGTEGGAWVGMFESGGLGGVTGVFACPGPNHLCVLVDGVAYLVITASPSAGAVIAHDQVWQVVGVETPALLLLVRSIDIVALGAEGIAWRTPRLVVDDLRVERSSSAGIVCTGDNIGGTLTIELDPTTGTQTAGTRLDSFWPPDALA
jgi:hypothetical protein